jgi:hypothetical protein
VNDLVYSSIGFEVMVVVLGLLGEWFRLFVLLPEMVVVVLGLLGE